jgi:hypothetical protein
MATRPRSALGVALLAWNLFLSAGSVWAETPVGWVADFDDDILDGAVEPHYVIRGSGGKIDDARLIYSISDGIVTLGGKFNPQSTQDYAPLTWRELDVSVTDYPVLDMRFRPSAQQANILVQTTYEFADGSQASPYFYATFEKADEWTTVTKRLVGDSSLPKTWTPRKLIHLHIWVISDRTVHVDFDWVRIRGLNDVELARETEWVELLKDYAPREPPILKEFFPFGVYAVSPDSSSLHKRTHRMSFRMISRHHLNFALAGGSGVEAADEMGVKMGVRVRPCAEEFAKGGADAAIEWLTPILDLVKNSPSVLCYDLGDERPIADLWGVAAAARILNKLDPGRPSVLTFWDPAAVRAYGPYVPVDVADIYPLVESGPKPAHYLYEWTRRVGRENGNKRQWMILQSFGAAPWRGRRGYIVPTAAELRLQIWSSLAGGARGIICYSTSYDRFRMLADQWNNPNELMIELSRLGNLIIPIGRRLLDCIVDFESTIRCDNEHVLIGVLRSPQRDATYVVAANKDVESEQGGRLSGFDGGLLDLNSLAELNDGRLPALLPGGGGVYLVGDPDQFRAESEAVRKNRDEEQERSETPDRLFRARGCDPEVLKELDETSMIMGTIEPAMYWDNLDEKVVELMAPYRDRYWALHAEWVSAYEHLLKGELTNRSAQILRYSKILVDEVRKALGDRPMYPAM